MINKPKIAKHKSTRQKGNYESFSEIKEYIINPNDSIKFCKPIVVLTNYRTASAAEIFLIALNDLPYVTTIGANIKGKLSNTMNYTIDENKELWGTLSNEKIYDNNKKCYEKVGVPADIEMINTLSDLQNDSDKLIIKAIDILNNKD